MTRLILLPLIVIVSLAIVDVQSEEHIVPDTDLALQELASRIERLSEELEITDCSELLQKYVRTPSPDGDSEELSEGLTASWSDTNPRTYSTISLDRATPNVVVVVLVKSSVSRKEAQEDFIERLREVADARSRATRIEHMEYELKYIIEGNVDRFPSK